MEFTFWPAVLAGAAGGVAMSILITMMRRAGKTEMDMALIEGAMFTSDRRAAKGIGAAMHIVVMSGLVIGSIYALLFDAFEVTSGNAWWVGALFGLVHGLGAGVFMAMLPAMHPRMGAADAGGALTLKPPGLFAKNYGSATPPGVVMVHVVYGLVVGLVYALLAG